MICGGSGVKLRAYNGMWIADGLWQRRRRAFGWGRGYMDGEKIVYQGGEGQIVEKKSRFIATVRPVKSEEEALEFIAAMKKKYWDATHNCSAFIIGAGGRLMRCSDDGEPQGTAGRPMLDVLAGERIYDAAVVVTRYFGGTLLGTGGLVRAYSKAVSEGLKASVVLTICRGYRIRIRTDYSDYGKIQYLLATKEIPVLDTAFTDLVELELVALEEQAGPVRDAIVELTSGRAQFLNTEPLTYGMQGNTPVILDS